MAHATPPIIGDIEQEFSGAEFRDGRLAERLVKVATALSMAPDAQLQALVDHHALRGRFLRVEGSPTASSDGNKAGRLGRHLGALDVAAARTVVIGDTVDDQEAAAECGARAVLVTMGSQSRAALEATGATVVDTLLEAAFAATGGM